MNGLKTARALALGAALGAGAAAAPAMAQDTGFSIGAGISTLGFTIEPRYRVNDSFGVRAALGHASLSRTETFDGVDFTGDVQLGGVALLGDYHLPVGGLRLSAGAFVSNYRANGNATAANLDIGAGTFDASVDTRIRARDRLSPMLAVGVDVGNFGGWSVSGDVGAIFTRLRGRVTGQEAGGNSAAFDNELATLQSDLNDELSALRVLPYISLMAVYRF